MKYLKEYYNFLNNDIIAYHCSEYKFDAFESDSGNLGNLATSLKAIYFLNDKEEVKELFGYTGYIYTVKLTPENIFEFDLDSEGWTYLDFQQKYNKLLAGLYNELGEYVEDGDVEEIDCVELTNLDYTDKKDTKEYIVFDEKIIEILEIEKIN